MIFWNLHWLRLQEQGRVQGILEAMGHRRGGDVQICNMPRWMPTFHSQNEQKKFAADVVFQACPEDSEFIHFRADQWGILFSDKTI